MPGPPPSRNPPIQPLEPFTPFSARDLDRSIPERFAGQVQQHGQRPAIQTDAACLTFQQLNGIANALARAVLSRGGAGPEAIALMFDQRAAIVASILAVLKAGKFYVVLDASHPRDRLRYLLEDSGAKLVIAESAHLALARQLSDGGTKIIDFSEYAVATDSGDEVNVRRDPDELATIIYTSGSTGRPKGVMHTHRLVLADVRNV